MAAGLLHLPKRLENLDSSKLASGNSPSLWTLSHRAWNSQEASEKPLSVGGQFLSLSLLHSSRTGFDSLPLDFGRDNRTAEPE